jgi:glycosyltransferase involved in cell wall biosynthesis
MEKIPISAVVVTRNEAAHLCQCLKGLNYCDEILVVDLQSTDESNAIANQFATKVIIHEPVPYVEIIHAKIKGWVRNPWLLITDPDEVADNNLQQCIIRNFKVWEADPKLGCIRAPMLYYVGERPFSGTGWGPNKKSRTYIVHRDRFEFIADIHKGRKLLPGFKEIYIGRDNGIIHHYWVESLGQLIKKCQHYLEQEKKVSMKSSPSLSYFLKLPIVTFYSSFFLMKGYKDGLLGFKLSLILTWYNTMAAIHHKGA